MKRRYLLILALCGAAQFAYGDEASFARQIAIEIEAERQRVERLDVYWANRGYHREGPYYYRGARESVGQTTQSAADLGKEQLQLERIEQQQRELLRSQRQQETEAWRSQNAMKEEQRRAEAHKQSDISKTLERIYGPGNILNY